MGLNLKRPFLVLFILTACPWPALSEVPGGPTSELLCSYRCNWEGYLLTVTQLPEGQVITVDRRPQVQYANGDRVVGLVGSLSPNPGSGATVTRVAVGATALDDFCNYEGFPLRGTVFLLERDVSNLYPFEAGSTPVLGNSTLCGWSFDQLREIYNSYVKPSQQVPFCSFYLRPDRSKGRVQGCRSTPKPKKPGAESMGPQGHTPAEFEGPGDVPKDYEDCEHWVLDGYDLEGKQKFKCLDDWLEGEAAGSPKPRVGPGESSSGETPCAGTTAWTPWLNRDNQGGSGDFEGLKQFVEAGQACPQPLDVECQTVDGRDWREAGQTYVCDVTSGGVCRNDQNGGRCLDYRVRFLCCSS